MSVEKYSTLGLQIRRMELGMSNNQKFSLMIAKTLHKHINN